MPRACATSNGSYRKGIFFPVNPAKPSTIRYWCTICGDSAGRLADFHRHMDCHSDNYQFICERSGCRQLGRRVGFRQKSNLSTHLNTAHNPTNEYACTHSWKNKDGTIEACAARFKGKAGLTSHRSRAHGFNEGDDLSKISTPTPEGADFEYHNGHRRGRRGDSAGAVIYFPDWCGNDHAAEAQFVRDVLSNTEQLKQSLAQHGVPYSTLPFHWPTGSSGGKQTTAKSSLGSPLPVTPVQYQSLAVSLAGTVARNPLPYPLTTDFPALATGSSTTADVGQQVHAYNPKPPALAPFFTQPLASGSAVPPPQPVPTQGTSPVHNRDWTAAPQATNLGLRLADTVLIPMPSGPPTFAGNVDQNDIMAALSPGAVPTPLSRDVVNVESSSCPRYYGLLEGALLDGVDDTSPEAVSEPTAGPDYQFLQEPWRWFPCGDEDPM